ncbi:Quinone oxidoreductase, partial [Caligus rogercresseyi]
MMGAKLRPGESSRANCPWIGATVVGTAANKGRNGRVSYCGAHNVFNHNHRSYQKKILSIIGEEGFDVIIEHLANVNL